jgi:hypothetical protein
VTWTVGGGARRLRERHDGYIPGAVTRLDAHKGHVVPRRLTRAVIPHKVPLRRAQDRAHGRPPEPPPAKPERARPTVAPVKAFNAAQLSDAERARYALDRPAP